MYDDFSEDYDRFVSWAGRLAYEMPFLEATLAKYAPGEPILDSACGTGMHAIALAQKGYASAGADLSPKMVERARVNAQKARVEVRFEAAGFGELAKTFGVRSFRAVLCLGNSLPHVLSEAELAGAIGDFAACLKPGGVLVLQNRNFDAVVKRRERWMEPQSYREGEKEWLFLRFYDYEPDGLISFNIANLRRDGDKPWEQRVMSTRLRPLLQVETVRLLGDAGFAEVACYGDMGGSPFNPETSGNLVVVARLAA
jgi:glycine/sarcosine N-methyltransferase